MRLAILPLVFLLAAPAVPGQVRLSEFMASNVQSVPDIVDFEAYPDWIELQNTTGDPVSLSGYFLSDDPARPLKWMIPGAPTIPANGFFKIWADGHDAQPGQSYPRGYWPWRNFTTEGYHTNFSLSSAGESLMLTQATGITSTPLIVAASPPPTLPATASTWRYLANGTDQSTQWRVVNFDDSAWSSGIAPLGYADTWIATTVPFGPSSTSKYITTYFRNVFTVANPTAVANLTLRLLVDDGVVVYLNGVEVVRQNMPAGDVSFATLASAAVSGTDESDYTAYSIPASGLLVGSNVIAVEVHQSAANSSDLGFDLSLDATTVTSYATVDSVSFSTQLPDISLGRSPADDTVWAPLAEPTPGAANAGPTVPDLRVAAIECEVSPSSGFYTAPQSVSLTAPSGEIRYTLDGSLPGPNSSLYATPISVSSTTVVRARVFASGKPPGPVETRTYFFGETPGRVPYISVVSDPKALFDNTLGIYYNQHEQVSSATYGLRDVYKGKDAPGSLEFFEPGGQGGFRVNGGFRMGGENNWASHTQRAMNFSLRGSYGDDTISYDLFPGARIPVHTGLTLREGGDRWDSDMLRDGLWASIARGQLTADTSDYRPAVVFINGVYWGLHDIRPRWDDHWFFEHKRINAENIDHLLYGHIDSGSVTLGVDKGDTTDWLDLMNFLSTADLNVPANYAFVQSRINIDSFIDFIVSESYSNNTSWEHNREFWRDRRPGGQWHWFLPDMDRTFVGTTSGVLSSLLANEHVLVHLKNCTAFKQRLAQRYAAHIGSTFTPARIGGIVDSLGALIDGELARHVAKWSSVGGTTVSGRASALTSIKTFMTARDANVHAEIQTQLSVSAPVNLSLALDTPGAGRFLIAGVPVSPGVLRMFPGIPFDLQVESAPGYSFAGWSGATGGATTSVTLTAATTITAQFVASGETLLGGTLSADTTLSTAASPYAVTSDLIVPAGITLTVQPGVQLRMSAGQNLRVQGALLVQGSAAQKVQILGRDGARWGGISFESPSAPSALAHLIIRNATRGFDPTRYPYAISGRNATLTMDFVDIDDSEGPIFCRGGSTILRDSRLHTPLTGDCINIKQGYAETWRTVFVGNNSPDTDAIDYDGVTNGIISGCRIYRFAGFNSDGVDIGESCVNVLLEGNAIYYNSDKGFSLGQGSTAMFRRNLVVGCPLGIGVKDAGSSATLDQNSFVQCAEGVALYEKNFGDGGGTAQVTNTLFSKCSLAPTSADGFSSLSVSYSLSDTVALPGVGNVLGDPLFVDPTVLNFQLQPGSPAIDAGDPTHAADPDTTRADIGALWTYAPSDYPYTIGATVVIEEILANSGIAADWIELKNRTAAPVNISGWFLSDDGSAPAKYRIPAGTILPPGGHVVFYEDQHFGPASIDPGRIVPFGLSDLGETVYISSAVANVITDYQNQEAFGASLEGESLGNFYKPTSDSYNFVPLATPTPGNANSAPRLGPVIISEIHYQPGNGAHADSEFFELMNVSSAAVSLFEADKATAWKISDGVDYTFPSLSPTVLQPGERMILTRSPSLFNAAYSVPSGTKVVQWSTGRLSNEGEQLQLVRPAGVDAFNVRQYARVDRVTYGITTPWPSAAAGTGASLVKIYKDQYGNDSINWTIATPNPGAATPNTFEAYTAALPAARRQAGADADGDGLANLVEYAIGTPSTGGTGAAPNQPFTVANSGTDLVVDFTFRLDHPSALIQVQQSHDLASNNWVNVPSTLMSATSTTEHRRITVPASSGTSKCYFRLAVQPTGR